MGRHGDHNGSGGDDVGKEYEYLKGFLSGEREYKMLSGIFM